ncbi:MGH1-like glycoside hydrolase domain-containing protein [Vallitalea okinawensis]|uniref:MGH1-like glycoside hydrolase domain-containing protein n=1 Tax=Vallitalea okinawensis TaxID=2078660 RepID=UPI000CFD9821|nr:hypothetical protein [Vallitalea okinawensis]
MQTYEGKQLKLEEQQLIDPIGTIKEDQLLTTDIDRKVITHGATPMVEKLVNIAIKDVESNIVTVGDDRYFGAGATFGASVFTRDISIAGILALNKFYPEVMMDSIKHTRTLREKASFTVAEEYIVEGIPAPWKVKGETEETLRGGPISRRSDDVIWIWGASDWIEKNGNQRDDWKWLYETGKLFFNKIYQYFYDAEDGLYRGQACFVDVHFPTFKANGYPLEWSIGDCVLVKATSTNSLYKVAMDKMAKAAEILGLTEDVKEWKMSSKALKEAMIKELTYDDGKFAFFKDKQGNLHKRQDALGTAFVVLHDIVEGDEAEKLIRQYPLEECGIPLFYPFYDFTEQLKEYKVHWDGIYHNNTSWGFVDTFFLMAYEKATDEDVKPLNIAMLARSCRPNSSFREVVNFINKEPFGSENQLWTAAAFLNVCQRSGIIDK